jgi:hypothetical protein
MNSPFAASDLNHALKQCDFTLNRVALADLQAFITVAGKIGGGEGSDDACRQRVAFERFQAFNFRICAFVLRSNLGDIAINELMKGGAFSLNPRNKNTRSISLSIMRAQTWASDLVSKVLRWAG